MLVFQTSLVGLEFFSYVNAFFCSRNLRRWRPREWNAPYVWATKDLTSDTRHVCKRFRVAGKNSNVTWFLRAKQIIKFANTSRHGKHGWICLFSQNKTEILVTQMYKKSFVKFLSHYWLLWGHVQSLLHPKNNNDHFHPNHLPLSSLSLEVLHFLLSRINKLDRDFLY